MRTIGKAIALGGAARTSGPLTGGQRASSIVELAVEGLSCASCVGRVEALLKRVPGVVEATVNLATERASVVGEVETRVLVAAIGHAGYTARPVDRTVRERHLVVAVVLTLPVLVLEMGSHLLPGLHDLVMRTIGLQWSWNIQFVLATMVILVPGARFRRKGFRALTRLAPDMDTLVAIGSMAAYLYSAIATFALSLLPVGTVNVYYESTAVIISLALLGRTIESRARGRTSQAIGRLPYGAAAT